jgi:hypothetical protein
MVPAMSESSDHGAPKRPAGPVLKLAGGPADAAPPAPAWVPTDALRGSQWARIGFGVGATAFFAAWMLHDWNTRVLRFAFALFACVVGYLAYRTIVDSLQRRRQRQVRLLHGSLYVSSCEGMSVIPLDQVLFAQWRSDMGAASGLWFFDREKKVLAHLNTDFLADAAQAKLLLGWAAEQHAYSFEVRWS